jgi:hypothetical protein
MESGKVDEECGYHTLSLMDQKKTNPHEIKSVGEMKLVSDQQE